MQSHYDELGIEPTASANEIHAAYRFLAQKFHPDMNIGRDEEAKRRFMRVQAAFDVLSDERMKTVYDAGLGAKPIIHIVQQMAAEQESFEPILISQSFRRKKKVKLSGAVWFLTACIFVATFIGYLTWQKVQLDETRTPARDSTALNQRIK